jgi:protein involved in polysaccharide export with SLBB domain
MTNPVADGIPVNRLPPESLGPSRSAQTTIPLACLGQQPPPVYRLGPGDILGIWIEGVLGPEKQAPPIQGTTPTFIREVRPSTPGLGFPIQVSPAGTVNLPQADPIAVAGLSVEEAAGTIRAELVRQQILKADKKQLLVTVLSPRFYHVVVLREETASSVSGPEGFLNTSRRGTGHDVYLPAYENDVLHALAQTGGLPAIDVEDEVVIYRACPRFPFLQPNPTAPVPEGAPPPAQVHTIPLRWDPHHELPFRPDDVLLQSGDVVYLKPRDCEVFYTAGLLPAGEHALPRDVDLDVIQAVCRVKGPLVNGAVAVSNLNGTLLLPGIGNPSPSLLTVLRKTPGGGQLPIRVDLSRALRDPRERILVQPGDVLVLQEKPEEAITRYVTQTFFNFTLAWEILHERFATGVANVNATQPTFSSIGTTVPGLRP